MTHCLPPNLLVFFAPREPIKYLAPLDHLPWETKAKPYTGVSQYLSLFEDPKVTPMPTRGETKTERRARKVRMRPARGGGGVTLNYTVTNEVDLTCGEDGVERTPSPLL